jgi:hypothetical protein
MSFSFHPSLSPSDRAALEQFIFWVKPWEDGTPQRFIQDPVRLKALYREQFFKYGHDKPDEDSEKQKQNDAILKQITGGWAVLKPYIDQAVVRWPVQVARDVSEQSTKPAEWVPPEEQKPDGRTLPSSLRATEKELGVPLTRSIVFLVLVPSPKETVLGLYVDGRLLRSASVLAGTLSPEEYEAMRQAEAKRFIQSFEQIFLAVRSEEKAFFHISMNDKGEGKVRWRSTATQIKNMLFPENVEEPAFETARWPRSLIGEIATLLQARALFGYLSPGSGLLVFSAPGAVYVGHAETESIDTPEAETLALEFLADAIRFRTVGDALRHLAQNQVNFDTTPVIVWTEGRIIRVGIASQAARAGRRKTLG